MVKTFNKVSWLVYEVRNDHCGMEKYTNNLNKNEYANYKIISFPSIQEIGMVGY